LVQGFRSIVSYGMERLHFLFSRYLDNSITQTEFAEFWQLLEQGNRLQELTPELQKLWDTEPQYRLADSEWDKKFKQLKAERLSPHRRVPVYKYVYRYAAAAVILFAVATGGYFLVFKKSSQSNFANTALLQNDVKPGTSGAILSFSNGKTFVLDTARNGQLTEGVTKNDTSVSMNNSTEQSAVLYATLTTPRAKKEHLLLADGTEVWLNAASSIRFPSKFTGSERVVEITGEVDIKVAHNDKMPFKTIARGQVFEDIGTEFNISAYDDEPVIRTTLLEGAIKTNGVVLQPSEQSVLIRSTGAMRVVKDADVELATAWKNGQQLFKQANIASIMRQVERWYDVDVVYETKVPDDVTFSGDLPRNVNLSELLKAFERKNVHFIIDGNNKKVTVTP